MGIADIAMISVLLMIAVEAARMASAIKEGDKKLLDELLRETIIAAIAIMGIIFTIKKLAPWI